MKSNIESFENPNFLEETDPDAIQFTSGRAACGYGRRGQGATERERRRDVRGHWTREQQGQVSLLGYWPSEGEGGRHVKAT